MGWDGLGLSQFLLEINMIQSTLTGLPPRANHGQFVCKACKKDRANKAGLARHIKVHTKRTPEVPVSAASASSAYPAPPARLLARHDSLDLNRRKLSSPPMPKAKPKAKGRAVNRGSPRRSREQTSVKKQFAVKIEKLLETGLSQRDVAEELSISQSAVSTWRREYLAGNYDITDFQEKKVACSRYGERVFGDAFKEVDKAVAKKARKHRKRKWDVSTEDLQNWAKEIKPEGIPARVRFSRKWPRRFKSRDCLRPRVATNKSDLSYDDEKALLWGFLAWFRGVLTTPCPDAGFVYNNDVWGRFPPWLQVQYG